MNIKLKTLTKCFIGERIQIKKSSNQSLVGLKGKIIDETKNLLIVDSGDKIYQIIKNQIIFEINSVIITGDQILKAPEDRIKMRIKNE
ncbi:MAG: ribonuclease P protein component 1 [Candidatus Woesearchaeota archaeon]